jgi:hypothetical protein
MANKNPGYGRNWKKWLAVYAVVGAAVYLIVYLAFFAGGGGATTVEGGCTDGSRRRGWCRLPKAPVGSAAV